MQLVVHALLALGLAAPSSATPCRAGAEARTITDASRRYGDAARPIRLLLWYPAEAEAARPVSLSALAAADWVSAADAREGGVAPERTDVAGCAGWEAPPRPGRFPLVLLGSGLTARAYFHSRLAEALADAGFVVAAVSNLGPAPGTAPAFDADSVGMLAADTRRVLTVLADDPRVDATRTGVVAWSIGTIVHLLIARDRPEVRAGVSLDGGLAYDYGPRLWAAVATTPPRVMPYLHLSAGVRGTVPADDTLARRLAARVEVMEPLAHAQFLDIAPAGPPEVERARAAVRRTVVEFLQAHLAAGAPR